MKALYIILVLTLSSCGAQKMAQTYKNTDFSKPQQAYAQEWIGGAPGSGSGIILCFPTEITTGYEVEAVYFRNKINTIVNYTAADQLMMVSRFNTDFNTKQQDLIMDLDSKKEIKNEAPSLEKFPFELKNDEAVIALKKSDSDKITYIKLTNIEERSQLALPSIPQ